MDTIKVEHKLTKIIAHRGLSSFETENTHAAFIAAGNRSYYGIECDIHKTKDGVFVVIHDDNTKRISLFNLDVNNSIYQDLLSLNLYDIDKITSKPYLKIPTFAEYLDICIKYDKACVIELKDEFSPEDINKIIDIVRNKNYLHNVIFISFIVQNLIYIRKHYQEIPLQLLVSEYNDVVLDLCLLHRFDFNISYSVVNKTIIDIIHRHHLLVNVWTVNNLEVAEKLISYGVDFITTDILE